MAECAMYHEPPFDFAWCETHDETFPLGQVCRFHPDHKPTEPEHAADKWVVINLVGGFVCSVCDDPVESEPCKEHQPNAYAAAVGDLLLEDVPSPRRASGVPLFEAVLDV